MILCYTTLEDPAVYPDHRDGRTTGSHHYHTTNQMVIPLLNIYQLPVNVSVHRELCQGIGHLL